MHGARECRLRPGADAGLRIGRDVGRIDHAEWSCHRVAARELCATLRRVTGRAVAAARQCFALGDQFRREAARSWYRDRSHGRLPCQHAEACKPERSESDDGDEQLLEHGVLRRLATLLASSISYVMGAGRVSENFQRTANRCEATVTTPARWMASGIG